MTTFERTNIGARTEIGARVSMFARKVMDIRNPLLDLLSKYGVPGLIFDNSPTSIFIDSAGTTKANIDDVAGRVNDLSGGEHHLEQSTTAAKPILRAGPLLEFDGTDDYLLHESQPFTGGELTVIWCGKFRAVPSGTHYIFTIADEISNVEYFGFYGGGTLLRAIVNNNGSIDAIQSITVVGTNKQVLSCRMNGDSAEVSLDQTRTTKTLAETLSLDTLERFGFGALVRPSVASFAGLDQSYAFVINKRLTDAELEQAERYIANLCGVTL